MKKTPKNTTDSNLHPEAAGEGEEPSMQRMDGRLGTAHGSESPTLIVTFEAVIRRGELQLGKCISISTKPHQSPIEKLTD